MIIQCPSCNTKFSIDADQLEGAQKPTFHCSRCGHYFSLNVESAGGESVEKAKDPFKSPQPEFKPTEKSSVREKFVDNLEEDFSPSWRAIEKSKQLPLISEPEEDFRSKSKSFDIDEFEEENANVKVDWPDAPQSRTHHAQIKKEPPSFSTESKPVEESSSLATKQMWSSVHIPETRFDGSPKNPLSGSDPYQIDDELDELDESYNQKFEANFSEKFSTPKEDFSLDQDSWADEQLEEDFTVKQTQTEDTGRYTLGTGSWSIDEKIEEPELQEPSNTSSGVRNFDPENDLQEIQRPKISRILDQEPEVPSHTLHGIPKASNFQPSPLTEGPQSDDFDYSIPIADDNEEEEESILVSPRKSLTQSYGEKERPANVQFIGLLCSVPILAVLAVWIFSAQIPALPNGVKEVLRLDAGKLPAVPPSGVELIGGASERVTLDDGNQVLEITGSILNATVETYSDVILEAAIFDKENQTLSKILVPANNALVTATKLSSLTKDSLTELQQREGINQLSHAPNSSHPFRIVFVEPPNDARWFSARVYSVRRP
jgi:predicted Zn finger-like uncharacterized protein